jgi:hypothetical protein
MGHTIIARLPRTQRWQEVVRLLAMPELRVADVAGATSHAARTRLVGLRSDPSLTYCFWLLVRLASAAQDGDFVEAVGRLGIRAQRDDSVHQFLARVADHTRVVLDAWPESGPFGELAALALRGALRETVGIHGRSLFGSPLEDLTDAFRRHSSDVQFGDLARRFFGDFVARTLRFYVDRALPGAAGGGGLATIGDTADFASALDLHARQTAKAVEKYAADWYSLKNWKRLGAIGQGDAADFVAHALEKLEYALELGAAR